MFTAIVGHLKTIALAGTLTGGAVCGTHAVYTHQHWPEGRFERPVAEQRFEQRFDQDDRRFDRNDHHMDRDHGRFDRNDFHHDRR